MTDIFFIQTLYKVRRALYEANKEIGVQIRSSSYPGLISLLMLAENGEISSQNKVLAFWIEWKIVSSRACGYSLLQNFRDRKLVETISSGQSKIVRLTPLALTWLKSFEKGMRKRRRIKP